MAPTTHATRAARRPEIAEKLMVRLAGQYARERCFIYLGGPKAELTRASRRRTTVPTRLSGVEAPDVKPTVMPRPCGSHPVAIRSSLAPTGLCRISKDDSR